LSKHLLARLTNQELDAYLLGDPVDLAADMGG
jgi:hypothetical protein